MTITGLTPRGGPVRPSRSRLTPLDSTQIRLVDGYWADWQQRNADTVIAHCEEWMERIGWIGNFDRAASDATGWAHAGIEFVDSEVYKLLEAMAWELGRGEPDFVLAARYEALVSRVAAAQEADGYLHTSFGRPWQPARYSNLEWGHELYCFGHLLQAASARIRTAGDGLLVSVGRRLADHLWQEFGPDGREAICGHPEIEVALAEFGRATGEGRYLELARIFVERRGHGLLGRIEYGQEYFQDETPVRDAEVLRGHAVRALYLAAGAFDVAVETDDAGLRDAVVTQWERTVAARTYLTGGMGSHHQDEAFGADHELPPDRSYAETCAAIASNMLSWRLLLDSGEARYADLIERTLLNAVMVSPREDGRAFYYANTLHQRADGTVPAEDELIGRALSSLRAPWFEVSCCPTNVARTLASVDLLFATVDAEGVQLHQFGGYDLDLELESGADVALEVRTGYPFDGDVSLTWRRSTEAETTLSVRVPAWAEGAVLVDGDIEEPVAAGAYATVRRRFAAGERLVLRLPMRPRFTAPDPRVDAVRGTLAVERGPLVLALESTDLPDGVDVHHVRLDPATAPEDVDGGATVVMRRYEDGQRSSIVSAAAGEEQLGDRHEVRLVPYASWANRGPSTMRVWMPTS